MRLEIAADALNIALVRLLLQQLCRVRQAVHKRRRSVLLMLSRKDLTVR